MILFHGSNKQISFPMRARKFFLSDKEFAIEFIEDFGDDEPEAIKYLYTFELKKVKLFDYRLSAHIEALREVLNDDDTINKIVSSELNWAHLEQRKTIEAIKSLDFDGHLANESGISYCIYRPDLKLTFISFKII